MCPPRAIASPRRWESELSAGCAPVVWGAAEGEGFVWGAAEGRGGSAGLAWAESERMTWSVAVRFGRAQCVYLGGEVGVRMGGEGWGWRRREVWGKGLFEVDD